MKLEFISNTGFYLENKGKVFGMDLWTTQGAFEGSWYHYPPLCKTKWDISDCSYIYISHIHPDHCDFNALKKAHKKCTFIVPNYFNKLLERKLNSFGFKNVYSLKPEETIKLSDNLEVKLFPQFVNNLFEESAFGNLIDSALLIKWDDKIILNCNDNYLTKEWAKKFKKQNEKIDLLLAPHSASGPYPSSFRNLSITAKKNEVKRLQKQYVKHWAEVVNIVSPEMAVPCAAEYIIAGEQSWKNPYIGLAEAKDAKKVFDKKFGIKITKAIAMDCGSILNLKTKKLTNKPNRKFSSIFKKNYISQRTNVQYDYHWEDTFQSANFDELVKNARKNLWDKQKRLNWSKDYNIYLSIDETPEYHFNFSSPELNICRNTNLKKKEPYLECFLSRQLFYRIITSKVHWNNAEGGLHIDFFRKPNKYVPEVYTLMSFLQN